MNGKLYEAFDGIHAEDELKKKTREYLARKTNGYASHRRAAASLRVVLVAACCCLALFFGGRYLYFTPTVQISVDINPSLELGINRFDRVVSVEGYNEDGKELADSLDLTFLSSTEAMDCILADETVAALLAEDEVLTVAVVGSDDSQCDRILTQVEHCTQSQPNAHCYSAHAEDVSEAHDLGLSYGKYQAYLEVQALDPEITPEEIQNMTMREIRDLIASLSGDDASSEGQTNAESASGTSNASQKGNACDDDAKGNGSGGSGLGNHHGEGNGEGKKHGGNHRS